MVRLHALLLCALVAAALVDVADASVCKDKMKKNKCEPSVAQGGATAVLPGACLRWLRQPLGCEPRDGRVAGWRSLCLLLCCRHAGARRN